MATASHDPSQPLPATSGWASRILVPEMWASLAISMMWLAVLFDALFGPDLTFSSGGGSDQSSIPSAIFVALFAYLATRAVARWGFRPRGDE